MKSIKIYTIGFTKKTAEIFFETLKNSEANKIVDVRLNNVSQLAGFAKKNDLIYFLKIINMDYIHIPDMAPTKTILDDYKKNKGAWGVYEEKFMKLMESRCIEKMDNIRNILNQSCLLCSEHEPLHCHRRLVVEYLQRKWKDQGISVQVTHL